MGTARRRTAWRPVRVAMIHIVLAWVFGSYGWPLVVMAIIPFGIVGALFGSI